MGLRRYKKISVNWEYLDNVIKQKGYSLAEVSSLIDVAPSTLYKAKSTSTMNPAVVFELCRIINCDYDKVACDDDWETISNGSKSNGRCRINWDKLHSIIRQKNYDEKSISTKLGKTESYLGVCKWAGGLDPSILSELCNILEIDENEVKDSGVSKSESIRKMVNNSSGIVVEISDINIDNNVIEKSSNDIVDEEPYELPEINVGTEVIHKKYGVGRIRRVEDNKINVRFAEGQEKLFQVPSSFINGFLSIRDR